jgi:ribose 5-phosphate isomerase RpiB
VFENLLTQVMIRMEDASPIKRKLFQHFMDVAKRCGADILDGKPSRVATACSTGWASCSSTARSRTCSA